MKKPVSPSAMVGAVLVYVLVLSIFIFFCYLIDKQLNFTY
jgi:hypothetical protein